LAQWGANGCSPGNTPLHKWSKGENESAPNFEWAPREVSAGVQKDCNVLTNKIHIPPSKSEGVTLITFPMRSTTRNAQHGKQCSEFEQMLQAQCSNSTATYR